MALQDPQYLLTQQYKDPGNLNTRIRLHALFSTNPNGIHPWMFDQFDLSEHAAILELGCGPGTLWQENAHRLPAGWRVTLTDFSPGMLSTARQNLANRDQFSFGIVDAQSIPYEDERFDAVMAHYMLYHVPDRSKAFAEIWRVLKPGGRLFAVTVGENHMLEIFEIMRAFDPSWSTGHQDNAFTLENGGAQIAPFFSSLELRFYEDSLAITKTEPFVEYILSMSSHRHLDQANISSLQATINTRLAQDGVIRVQKHSGMFVAQK